MRPRSWWFAAAAVLVTLVAAASILVWRAEGTRGTGLAAAADITASSSGGPSTPRAVADTGSATDTGAGWQSDGDTRAWVEMAWTDVHALRRVVIVRNPVDQPGVTAGFLSFGDGSRLQVRLSDRSPITTISFTPRSVDRLRFTASASSPGARDTVIAEIIVSTTPQPDDVVVDSTPHGDAALAADGTTASGGSDPAALHDGSGAPGAIGSGADWTTDAPTGSWVQLTWARPRELSSVEIVGSAASAAMVGSATVTFGDGSTLPIGAVLSDPGRPTIVGFMPRVTTSLRFSVDRVTGGGRLALGELRAYQRGATPVRPIPPASSAEPSPVASCSAPAAGRPGSLVVRCPTNGAAVDRDVDLSVSTAQEYTAVTASVWSSDAATPAGEPVAATPDGSGSAQLHLDVSDLPPGPFTVVVEATSPSRATRTVTLQLDRRGSAGPDLPPSAAAGGRTMVYSDEFDRPVSASRNGIGADYAAGKPTSDGAEDFGSAPFGDPAKGADTVQVVDDRYLRLSVEPRPPGSAGPHVGALLASARQGGSGFSAQYGYFEARMLVPSAPGTWPAFWMLPSDNLVAPQPLVAEVDAVELYGHDPQGACHSTHSYGKETKGGVTRCGQRFESERAAAAWHTYGVSITPTDIAYFIDGVQVATAPQVAGGGSPMFFLLDMALGGGWPVDLSGVQDRASLFVDYVRVYV